MPRKGPVRWKQASERRDLTKMSYGESTCHAIVAMLADV